MSDGHQLILYLVALAVGVMATAAVPMVFPQLRRRMHLVLSFSAGVLLGAAFFHMLPEAIEVGGLPSLYWALGGFVFLFLLERYVLIHWCKEDELWEESAGHEAHAHAHAHAHDHGHGSGTLGMATLVGMSIHTLTDGFALGTAVEAGIGASVFLAILLHKLPSSFSLSSILLHENYAIRRTLQLTGLFALTLPLGVLLYVVAAKFIPSETFGPRALGFSAGTFLHLAVADLIPDLHRRRSDRFQLSAALIAGILLMAAAAFLGPEHSH